MRSNNGPRFNASLKIGSTIVSAPVFGVAIFLVAAAVLAWGIDTAGIAAPYSDPVARIRAQDEAFYVNSAIRMTEDGDWLSPKVMGRLFLFKPPLVMWMAAACVRLLGLSLFAVRLPSLILGAAGIAVAFLWAARARSIGAGCLAAVALLSSPLWQSLSRLCYTDVPGSVFALLALFVVALDPPMRLRRTAICAGIFGAASILSKSVAGLIPFATLGLYWVLMPRERRPRFTALVIAGATAVAVLAPWHVYQIIVHPKWFYADYVEVQLLGIGLTAARNGIFDRPALFYLERLIRLNPLPLALALLGAAGAIRVIRERSEPVTVLALCQAAVTVLALGAFQAKNLPYLVFLLPPLCIAGAACAPRWIERRPWMSAMAVLLSTVALARTVPVEAAPPVNGARAMRAYHAMRRDTDLIACSPDDEFYGTLIPIRRVRYCFVDPSGAVGRIVPHYPPLGIVLTGGQFLQLPELLPGYRARLAEWGLHSTETVGTSITIPAPAALSRILRERPDLDAYLPAEWTDVVEAAAPTHEVRPFSRDRVFLISRTAKSSRPVQPLPARW